MSIILIENVQLLLAKQVVSPHLFARLGLAARFLSTPPFSASIALASRFKGTGLSSLTPGASRSQRRSKQVSPHLYLPASRWHQGLKKQVCPPFIQQHRAARQGLKKQVCPPFLQEHRAPREGSSPVASPASPSSIWLFCSSVGCQHTHTPEFLTQNLKKENWNFQFNSIFRGQFCWGC